MLCREPQEICRPLVSRWSQRSWDHFRDQNLQTVLSLSALRSSRGPASPSFPVGRKSRGRPPTRPLGRTDRVQLAHRESTACAPSGYSLRTDSLRVQLTARPRASPPPRGRRWGPRAAAGQAALSRGRPVPPPRAECCHRRAAATVGPAVVAAPYCSIRRAGRRAKPRRDLALPHRPGKCPASPSPQDGGLAVGRGGFRGPRALEIKLRAGVRGWRGHLQAAPRPARVGRGTGAPGRGGRGAPKSGAPAEGAGRCMKVRERKIIVSQSECKRSDPEGNRLGKHRFRVRDSNTRSYPRANTKSTVTISQ